MPVVLLCAGAIGLRAETIDRIAVSAGTQVITTSDIDREIRVNSLLDRVEPDFSPDARRKTAGRMVDQRLIRRELELSKYPAPSPKEVEPVLKKTKDEFYPTDARYQAALAHYGVTDGEVRGHILWQLTLLRFIEARFRPGVSVSGEAVEEYFKKNIKPANAKATLDGERDTIVETLTQEQMDRDLDAWLAAARRRTNVEYREGAFR